MNKWLLTAALVAILTGYGYLIAQQPSLFQEQSNIDSNNSLATTTTGTVTTGSSVQTTKVGTTVNKNTKTAATTTAVTTTKTAATTTQTTITSGCGVHVTATGGVFAPTTCEFEIVSNGVPACTDNPKSCPGNYDYVLSLKDRSPSHLLEMTLLHIKDTRSGTYYYNAQTKDFAGYVLDQGAGVRNLESGTLTLDWHGDTVTFSLDASFANAIHIKADGTVPVKKVYAS